MFGTGRFNLLNNHPNNFLNAENVLLIFDKIILTLSLLTGQWRTSQLRALLAWAL